MSWTTKRRLLQTNATANSQQQPNLVQMYDPNQQQQQHSNREANWQQQQEQQDWYNQQLTTDYRLQSHQNNQQQHDYWQPYCQQQQQQPAQNHHQRVVNNPMPQYQPLNQQSPLQNQRYYGSNTATSQNVAAFAPTTTTDDNSRHYETQNALYIQQQQMHQHQVETGDKWNWGWGDEDNSNVLGPAATTATSLNQQIVADSFATNDESWNWTVDETLSSTTTNPNYHHPVVDKNEPPTPLAHEPFTQMGALAAERCNVNQSQQQEHQEQKEDDLKDDVVDRLCESQISQDCIGQSAARQVDDSSATRAYYRQNREQSFEAPAITQENVEVIRNKYDAKTNQQNSNLVQQQQPPPPPPQVAGKNVHSVAAPPQSIVSSTSAGKLNVARQSELKNPYNKRNNNTLSSSSSTHELMHQNDNKSSGRLESNRTFGQFNLESVPDNSEQPDVMMPQYNNNNNVNSAGGGKSQQPDNNEIAPTIINDRNQYLETGRLSDESNNLRLDADVYHPPHGLRRLVLGQIERQDGNDNNSIRNFIDEHQQQQQQQQPPPGLSRMVLGQQTEMDSSPETKDTNRELDSQLLVGGLRRMIPGESSPPPGANDGDALSETDLADTPSPTTSQQQQRSATTIGADTPPAMTTTTSINNHHRRGTLSHTIRETHADGANISDAHQSTTRKVDDVATATRRGSIEGQTSDQSSSMVNLLTSVRDLTVGNDDVPIDVTSSRNANRAINKDSSGESDNNDSEDDVGGRRKISRHKRSKERDEGHAEKRYDRKTYRRDDRYGDKNVDEEYYSDYGNRKKYGRDKRSDETDEYETRRYASLKRDGNKQRNEPRRRDIAHRRDYYDRDEEDDDEERDQSKSRPASRSDSYRDAYRVSERERRRDRPHYKRTRDPYAGYNMPPYPYDPYNSYYQQQQYQQYQYYENLRRTNPQAYAEWYRKYYQQSSANSRHHHQQQQSGSYATDDRASVHSGRSSANEDIGNKDRYSRHSFYSQSSFPHHHQHHQHFVGNYYRDSQSTTGHYDLEESSYSRAQLDQTDSSLLTQLSQRMTPMKFTSGHVKATISSGRLVRIRPSYSLADDDDHDDDHQTRSTVDIQNLQNYFDDDEYVELNDYPGPLIKDVTHKKTIIEYCERKIQNVTENNDHRRQIVVDDDVDSYVLMWELLILLLRQNGMVVGTDIAELLMKNRKSSLQQRPMSVSSVNSDDNNPSESNVPISEFSNGSSLSISKTDDVVTNKFRDLLIYGSVKEALEWAIKHGLWGHALFLASKLDKRTYANVMMKFANGLAMNDPLQTLYQLLSGKLPASVTCVADDKWGDWRPHLAMILSNTSQRPDLERKSITTLGDTLFNRGSIYAAQFCYLMAQVGFGRYDDDAAAAATMKLVLLGANHAKPFARFATNEAIHMTEIYEYACRLNDTQFNIPEFQIYKYLLATRLADRGLLEKSLSYLEQIAMHIVQNPVRPSFVDKVYELADRLKYYDLVVVDGEENPDASRIESSWLNDLKKVQSGINMGLIMHSSTQNLLNSDTPESDTPQQQQAYENVPQQEHQQQWQYQQQPPPIEQQMWQQPEINYDRQQQSNAVQHTDALSQYQEQATNWSNQYVQQQQWQESDQQMDQFVRETDRQQANEYWNSAHSEAAVPAMPQISMPNQSKTVDNEATADDDANVAKRISPAKQQQAKRSEKPATTGWFGGIWNKLALRPKNQMKLPDDKNPTIVWDAERKRWMNLEEENTEAANEIKPPPKMSEMMIGAMQRPYRPSNETTYQQPQSVNSSLIGASNNHPPATATPSVETSANPVQRTSQSNMFKLQKQRNLKKSYVDIFNPGAAATKSSSAVNNNGGQSFIDAAAAGATANQMNFFVPQPVTDPNAPLDFLTTAAATANPIGTQMASQ